MRVRLACHVAGAQKLGCDWGAIQAALDADPMVSNHYSRPVHKGGRGAGGPCFIKDIAACARHYGEAVGRLEGQAFLAAAQTYNAQLLMESKKDVDLLKAVYGLAL
jgi:UDP-glucose 6-dehydrogenase